MATRWQGITGRDINTTWALWAYDSILYVGGEFDSAGGVYAKNIARLTTPLSINEITENNNIVAYPNPAKNTIDIEMEQFNSTMSYTIYNELGQQVDMGQLHAKNNALNVSNYANGVYLISVYDDGRQYTTKFIKN